MNKKNPQIIFEVANSHKKLKYKSKQFVSELNIATKLK
tara:strand:+ start:761 stop:874 length:114 start_codon:yes stop_codon:yes gene_type:complete